MANAFRVTALFTLLLIVQLSASASVKGRPVASSPVVKTEPDVKAVKAPQAVAADPLPAPVQPKEPVQKQTTVELVQKEKVVEPVPADAPQKVNKDETKSVEDAKKAEIEAGDRIQGDGPFVVNAQQLPPNVREEIMKQLNTQYRISQEKKQQQKQQAAVKGQVAQVKSDHVVPPAVSEDESFDPELAAGIAELLTRMAVEDDVGNQYIDLEELPAALKLQVTEYLTKQQTMDDEKEFEEHLKLLQQAEKVKAQEASLLNKQQTISNSHIDELLNSLLQGDLADYPAPAAGHYPQRYAPYAYPQRPAYSSGYPLYGVYPQYGGYPSANQYHGSFRPYSGLATYPYAALKGYYPVSYGSRPYVPQSSLMARERLPQLYGGSVGPKPLPFRTISASPVAGFSPVPADYLEELKPEDQPTPLATYYAYYRQLFGSQAQPVGSRYAQASRIHPADLAVQQPRPYVNYKFRRY